MNSLIISTFLLTLMVIGTLAQVPGVTLFSHKGCRGFYLKIGPTSSTINLQSHGFNQKAQSVRKGGSWIFYNETVPSNTDGDSEIISLQGDAEGCYDFTHLSNKVSALRTATHLDQFTKLVSGITFYTKPNFYGALHQFSSASSNIGVTRVASIVITGTNPWTIYAQPNYKGAGLCIYPEDSTGKRPTFISDVKQMETPINYDFIKSALPSCSV